MKTFAEELRTVEGGSPSADHEISAWALGAFASLIAEWRECADGTGPDIDVCCHSAGSAIDFPTVAALWRREWLGCWDCAMDALGEPAPCDRCGGGDDLLLCRGVGDSVSILFRLCASCRAKEWMS